MSVVDDLATKMSQSINELKERRATILAELNSIDAELPTIETAYAVLCPTTGIVPIVIGREVPEKTIRYANSKRTTPYKRSAICERLVEFRKQLLVMIAEKPRSIHELRQFKVRSKMFSQDELLKYPSILSNALGVLFKFPGLDRDELKRYCLPPTALSKTNRRTLREQQKSRIALSSYIISQIRSSFPTEFIRPSELVDDLVAKGVLSADDPRKVMRVRASCYVGYRNGIFDRTGTGENERFTIRAN